MAAKKGAKAKPRVKANGQPTRAERRKTNKSDYARAKKDFSLYMPPVARARYTIIIEEIAKHGPLNDDEAKRRAVLSLIAGGLSLRQAREVVDVKHMDWHKWLRDVEGLQKEYNLAKEERTEAWADDIMDDAESANAFNAQAVRLRIETKKWLMGKNSGRYADKVVIAGDPNAPLTTVTREMTKEEAQDAYNQMKKGA